FRHRQTAPSLARHQKQMAVVVGVRPGENLVEGEGRRVALVPPPAVFEEQPGQRQAPVPLLQRLVHGGPREVRDARDRAVVAAWPAAEALPKGVRPGEEVLEVQDWFRHRPSREKTGYAARPAPATRSERVQQGSGGSGAALPWEG